MKEYDFNSIRKVQYNLHFKTFIVKLIREVKVIGRNQTVLKYDFVFI